MSSSVVARLVKEVILVEIEAVKIIVDKQSAIMLSKISGLFS